MRAGPAGPTKPAAPSRPNSAMTSQGLRLISSSRVRLTAAALLVALCVPSPRTARAATAPSVGAAAVAWLAAANDADIDKAFATAKAQNKPVLLYWGAKWCPPCNQLKATLFNRADFIERSKSFVAVNVDGDLPGAQKLGSRFKVRGYPTLILMGADGSEITRLPGEADAPQVMNVLQLGMAGGRPVKAVLADATAGKPVSGTEWRMLAFYSWDTDESQLVPEAERPALLAKLAGACPASEREARTRLMLKSLAESDDGKGAKADAALRSQVTALLADPAASRAQADMILNWADDLVKALAPQPGADRSALAATFDTALQRLQADATLSRADQVSALYARVALARIDMPADTRNPKLPPALQQEVRDQASRMDREITDGYERQAVITSVAATLGNAGLWKNSDDLLNANLAKSHSPYYLMSQLADNARKQGNPAEALRWYEEAFSKSEGPATRLQWGSSYVAALIDLAPQDAARIEKTVAQLLNEAAQQPNAFYERSVRSLQRVGRKLADWNKSGQHAAVVKRLQGHLGGVCDKVDAGDGSQRATCQGLFTPPPAAKA